MMVMLLCSILFQRSLLLLCSWLWFWMHMLVSLECYDSEALLSGLSPKVVLRLCILIVFVIVVSIVVTHAVVLFSVVIRVSVGLSDVILSVVPVFFAAGLFYLFLQWFSFFVIFLLQASYCFINMSLFLL